MTVYGVWGRKQRPRARRGRRTGFPHTRSVTWQRVPRLYIPPSARQLSATFPSIWDTISGVCECARRRARNAPPARLKFPRGRVDMFGVPATRTPPSINQTHFQHPQKVSGHVLRVPKSAWTARTASCPRRAPYSHEQAESIFRLPANAVRIPTVNGHSREPCTMMSSERKAVKLQIRFLEFRRMLCAGGACGCVLSHVGRMLEPCASPYLPPHTLQTLDIYSEIPCAPLLRILDSEQ